MLESRSKSEIEQALKKATANAYQHGDSHFVLEYVHPDRVKTLSHGSRLFDTLSSLIRDEAEA